ncbi:Activated CDC42 kinase 1 [Tolypocladium ophioglossoides CBS 100239]|uniref:Activated CDC42 kinase 1 n=1 Tax=Tolypocladium ophioglossoides (strain CBS 100239) TaxID=1163406 RepID=A0A0L0N7T1_TOLOC|nr:Activated CDC42 kinase 1 [Tolypocladium ophioglossoides CBS 100239]
MCFKAAPATVYRKCNHRSDGVEKNPPQECLTIRPSQGLVYALDEDVVLKVPFQYGVTEKAEVQHYLDLSLASFVAMEKELAVYNTLQSRPHINFLRRFATGMSDGLFLERLEPLQKAWPRASRGDRERWVLEFLEAKSWLEEIGFVHGDLAVRNLGVDRSNRLKLFDFGSAISRSHPDFPNDVMKDHFDLATCVYFLLSGVDPFANVRSRPEAGEIRTMLESRRWIIGEDAESLASIIQDGWTGKNASLTFHDVLKQAIDILGTPNGKSLPSPREHYGHLESRCQDWLRLARRHPSWKHVDEYVSACRIVGHEADLDVWR